MATKTNARATSLAEYMKRHPAPKKKVPTLAEYMREHPAPKEEPWTAGYAMAPGEVTGVVTPAAPARAIGAGVTPPPQPKAPARRVGPGYEPYELERYRELRAIPPPVGEARVPWAKVTGVAARPGKPPKLRPEAAEPVLSRARAALGPMFADPLHELHPAAKPWGVIRDIAKGFATFPFHLAKAAAHDIANKAPDETLEIASDWLWGTFYTAVRPREWLPKQLGGRGGEYSVEAAIGDILVATLVGRGLLKGRPPALERPAPKYTLAADPLTGEAKIVRVPVQPEALPPLPRRPWEIPVGKKPPRVPAIERAKIPGRKTLEELRAEVAEPRPKVAAPPAEPAKPPVVEEPAPPVAPKPKAEVAAKPPTAKEPWEMTREEFWLAPRTEELVAKIRDVEYATVPERRAAEEALKQAKASAQKAGLTAHEASTQYVGTLGPTGKKRPVPTQRRLQRYIDAVNEAEQQATRVYMDTQKQQQALLHEGIIAKAVREGKPVPPEVLADYPDLAAKYAKPPAKPAAKPAPPAEEIAAEPLERLTTGELVEVAQAADIVAEARTATGMSTADLTTAVKAGEQSQAWTSVKAVLAGEGWTEALVGELKSAIRKPAVTEMLTGEAGAVLVRRPPKPEAMQAAEELTKGTIRTYSAQTIKAGIRADKWARDLPEAQLEDIAAVVERTGNPLIEGDTLAAARARLTPKAKAVLEEYRTAQEQARTTVNEYMKGAGESEYIKHLDDYVPHFYTGWTKATKNRFLKNSPNARQRKIPTLKEAVEEYGLTPITLNVAKLHKMWAEINWRVATNRRFLHELRRITTEDGTKVVKTKDAPANWVYFDHPLIRRVWGRKTAEGKLILREGGVWVHPDVAQAVKQIVQQPSSAGWVKAIEWFNGFAKEASLSLTLFHHGALTESSQAVLARIFNPLRGILRVGPKQEFPVKRLLAQRPHRMGVAILEAAAKDPKAMAIVEDAINHGLQLGRRSSDVPISRIARQLAGLEAKMRRIPVLGQAARRARQFHEWYHKILWDRYHAGLKLFSYYDIVGEQIARYGPGTKANQSVKTLKETLASHLNDAYGGQEWGAKFWLSPRGLQIARMCFLAPDWTLSAASVAVKTFTKDPALRHLQVRYWRNMIPTLMGSAICAQQAVHQFAVRMGNDPDHQQWCIDNEVGHKWDVDVTPIIRALPWHDPDDKRRRYSYLGKQAREVLRWGTDPLMAARRKSSPVVQVAAEQIFDTQGGGWDMPWAEKPLWGTLGERGKAVGAKFVPFSFRGSNFMMTAPIAKGMTYWKAGVALDKALESYANPSMWPRASKHPQYVQKLDDLVGDILDAAELNDVDTKKAMQYAMARVRSRHYRAFFAALDKGDGPAMDKSAKAVVRLHAGMRNLLRSAKARDITLTPEERRTLSTAITEARETLGVTPRTYYE